MLIGVFLDSLVQALLPGEVVRALLSFAFRGLGELFGAGDAIRELPGGPSEVI